MNHIKNLTKIKQNQKISKLGKRSFQSKKTEFENKQQQ